MVIYLPAGVVFCRQKEAPGTIYLYSLWCQGRGETAAGDLVWPGSKTEAPCVTCRCDSDLCAKKKEHKGIPVTKLHGKLHEDEGHPSIPTFPAMYRRSTHT